MRNSSTLAICILMPVVLLSACGGGGDTSGSGSDGSTSAASSSQISQAARTLAAQTTANSQPYCVSAQPFYWEVGDANGTRASGSTGSGIYTATTRLSIASASKWIYGSYVVQKRGGVHGLNNADISALHFTSGYSVFPSGGCNPNDTVGSCDAQVQYAAATLDRFDYSGGHMQRHADLEMGLGALDGPGLASEMRTQLGSDLSFTFTSPQPAGGGFTSAADYASLLRKIMSGQLAMHDALGSSPACANPFTCKVPDNLATYSPIPSSETWHYSIGHWIEDDPVVGDGSYSSPGAFGFYPWISHDLSTYGIVARQDMSGSTISDPAQKPYMVSVECGRLIRKAWFTGQAIVN
ncbi:MAG: hypothetical protein EPO09_16080 [Aquabacterium sp.]|uniref:hypothetical protein n=1 Tax=Aquabacterium sp. TaxID=1872578 RepID=UPI00120ED881|nr:hypothetical protein [Aquabacterium sp.]TAK91390.1 MAG: hypothetical protein EPO09_16080 [Aquabacterium sp.]